MGCYIGTEREDGMFKIGDRVKVGHAFVLFVLTTGNKNPK